MVLNDLYKSFVDVASTIDGFVIGQKEDVPYDINYLANKYCEAVDMGDEQEKNKYISALMVRYWHMVPYLYEKSKSCGVEMEDMVDWLYESFDKAFQYRSWLDPNKAISKDKKGAEKCFNQCITSTRQRWYKHFNQACRRINYSSYDSLDAPIKNGDGINLIDTIVDDSSTKFNYCNNIVQQFINKNDYIEALIIDGIINQDTFVTHSKSVINEGFSEENDYTSCEYQFSMNKLFKHLRDVDDNFISYFSKEYSVDKNKLLSTVSSLKSYSNTKFRKCVQLSFQRIKQDKEVLSTIC